MILNNIEFYKFITFKSENKIVIYWTIILIKTLLIIN